MPRWRLKAAVGVAALVLVSMAIGGAVVAAAYQAQGNELRDLLSAGYERRADLARQRLALAREQVQTEQQRVAIGLGNQEAVLAAGVKVAEAEASLKVIDLQIQEIRIAAREPLGDVSSPLVSGRDFVTERWKIEASVPAAALEFEQGHLRGTEQRVAVGLANMSDVEISRARILELEAGIEAFHRKIDVRQRFLKGELDAAMADLRMLEGDAEQRRKALVPKIELARKTVAGIDARIQVGMAQTVERTDARLRVLQLETELARLDNELAVIRRQIAQRGGR